MSEVHWITDNLATGPFHYGKKVAEETGSVLVDVRPMVDREGNNQEIIKHYIDQVVNYQAKGEKVIVCCDMGISRSNSIALGSLIVNGMSFEDARALVKQKAGDPEINIGMINDVRSIFEKIKKEKSSKNILVTGSRGYIGKALVKAIKEDYNLFTPGHAELDLTKDLVSIDNYVKTNGIGYIIHLAHPHNRNHPIALGQTLTMMKNILEVCRMNEVGLLYLSSLTVFSGYLDEEITLAQSSLTPNPKGAYAESKYFCERLIKNHIEQYGLEASVVRPAGIYGPEMPPETFVAKFITAAKENRLIKTHEYQNGAPGFDFLHIDDLIEALKLVLEKKPVNMINIGTGVGTSTYEIAELIVELSRSESKVEKVAIDDRVNKIAVNTKEAEQLLGWKSKTGLREGLIGIINN